MSWVAWRQQRPATVAAAALLAVAGLILVASGWQVTTFARDSGLAACVATGGDCQLLAEAFTNRYGAMLESVSALGALLPVALGLLVGGPRVRTGHLPAGLDPERHPRPLARRPARHRWRGPGRHGRRGRSAADLVVGALRPAAHQQPGGAGTGQPGPGRHRPAGVLHRHRRRCGDPPGRARPGHRPGRGPGGGPCLNLAAQSWLAPRPLTITYPAARPSPRAAPNDQVLSSSYRDRTGRDLPAQALDRLCSRTAGQAVGRCLAANGIQRVDRYQPASRAWQRALTQSALYLAVSAIFLALTWWRTLRPD
jgi:hypothetical protein